MNTLNRFLIFLHPELKLQTTPWLHQWKQRQWKGFLLVTRVYLLLAIAAYLAHYVLIDIPLNLQPRSLWLTYRLSMAGTAALAFALTSWSPIKNSAFFRLPTLVAGIVFCHFQVRTMVWFDQVPYIYAFVIAAIATSVLLWSAIQSFLYIGLLFLVQSFTLQTLSIAPAYLISAGILTTVCVLIVRSRMSSEIDAFISEQNRIEVQKKLIESEMELNQQIRAFLPGVIYKKMTFFRQRMNMNVHEAMEEVLRPRSKAIACLFTDIRGYTQRTKSGNTFVFQSALPNIRACTELVETYHGVPRHVGDLIFSYFDGDPSEMNILRALACGAAIHDKNVAMNGPLSADLHVKRFILVSFGTAIVGNIGGNDGSREITALGTPANLVSRLDELTKDPTFLSCIASDCLILSRSAAEAALKTLPALRTVEVDLMKLDLRIRDFPEENTIFLLPLSAENRSLLETSIDQTESAQEGIAA